MARCSACLQGDIIWIDHGDGTGHYECSACGERY
jgi:Zn ribbon nucleic-acid-binding protein